jgi:RNA 2',3'-cyclic 3'-phosphodiesterase
MARLFAAIRLDDEARAFAARAIAVLERIEPSGRSEALEKLHVTLAFFGSVPVERIGEFSAALERAASESMPFCLRLDRIGAFPDEKRPRLLWLGSSRREPAYEALMARMREAFAGLWSQPRDEDVPHVTLRRLRSPLRAMPDVGDIGTVDLPVGDVVLFESLPDGATTRYEIKSVAPLVKESPSFRSG